jgi:hypothetical protein
MEAAATAETAATMEATTTEASSTAAAVPGGPRCGTERHEGNAN